MSVEILDLGALALTAVFFALLYYLHKKKQVDFGVRTILAVGLGLIVGLAFKGHHTYVAAVGTIYAHVVSAVVIPLLIFSIISSITNLGNSVRLKQIGLKTVFFLVLNTFIASLITLIAGVATNIGSGVQYELATDYTAKEVPTFVDTVISLFPQNLAAHWSNQHRGYGAYRYERCGRGYRHHPCGRYRRAAGHCRLQWHGGDARGRSLRVISKKLFATKIQFKKRNQEKHWFAHEKANLCFFLIKERNKMKIYNQN